MFSRVHVSQSAEKQNKIKAIQYQFSDRENITFNLPRDTLKRKSFLANDTNTENEKV